MLDSMANKETTTNSIDEILEDFDLDGEEIRKDGSLPVTFWIPMETKDKYARIQAKTRRRFGKKIKEVLIASIDRFDE